MNPARISQIVRYALGVASRADNSTDRELGPIHLLKFAYLADVAHASRRNGETFTGVPWVFFHLGPWDGAAHDVIETAADNSGAAKRLFDWGGKRDGIRWSVDDERLAEQLLATGDELPLEVASAVQAGVRTFGANTYSLLDEVYRTFPMLRAAPNERLDFSVEQSDSAEEDNEQSSESVRPAISRSEARRRREAWIAKREGLRERVRAGGARRRQLVAPPTVPVYDETFAAGVAALDAEAGPAIPELGGTAIFSPEIWKSRGRRESGVS